MPRHSSAREPSDPNQSPRRAEVETISLRLPTPLMNAIRAHCSKHAAAGTVLGMQPPTISSVIRQLVEERFGPDSGKSDAEFQKRGK